MDKDLSLTHPGETRPINSIIIDTLDMNTVQMFITASHSRDLTDEERKKMRTMLDKWERALTLAGHIKVTF